MTLSVSRETSEALELYAAELLRWTQKINLISRADQADLWDRHIADSLQVDQVSPSTLTWLDLGSGGGLPAIPIAILRRAEGTQFTLIESDARKCAFLRHVVRLLDLPVSVVTARIEVCPPVAASIISARALAPLPELLRLAVPHATPSTVFVFPKGEEWQQEVDSARENWQFTCDTAPSKTRPGAAILSIQDVRPR